MEKEKADLVASDPPFNVPILGHVTGLGKVKHRQFAQAVGELLESEFIAFLERSFRNAADWSATVRFIIEQVNLCVWVKSKRSMESFYRSQHELFDVWRKGMLRQTNNVEFGRFGPSRKCME